MPKSTADTAIMFLRRCEEWLCDGYSYDLRYVAAIEGSEHALSDASLSLNPLPHAVENGLIVRVDPVLAGQDQAADMSKAQLLATVEKALAGTIRGGGRDLTLPSEGAYRLQVGSASTDTWYQPLTCQLIGAAPTNAIFDSPGLDTGLRASNPPFDGADDLRNWLGVRMPVSGLLSAITITVGPPVDVLTGRSGLVENKLRLVLSSHRSADLSLLRLGLRAVPGDGLQCRLQIADRIEWREVSNGLLEGTVEIELPEAMAALSMLLFGSQTVRRHWFVHPAKAANYRFASVQQFDPELRMVRRGLFDSNDAWRFEAAVAVLLFIAGFSAAMQLETDSPDLIVATPAGRIVLVECATRIADVRLKVGKLVDRRGSLQKALRSANGAVDVAAVLICRLPRNQLAVDADYIRAMGIVLAAEEELVQVLTRAQFSSAADEILSQALHALVAEPSASPESLI